MAEGFHLLRETWDLWPSRFATPLLASYILRLIVIIIPYTLPRQCDEARTTIIFYLKVSEQAQASVPICAEMKQVAVCEAVAHNLIISTEHERTTKIVTL